METSEKRIVLVGYRGSGKTMLAIGLFRMSQRKGVAVTISDSGVRDKLRSFVAAIESGKKFPQPTPLVDDPEPEKTDRMRYPFEFIGWRGEKFTTVFEDYAGERVSNLENEKEFDGIIGNEPHGAVLLLNPGMRLFRKSDDPQDIKDLAGLTKLYTAMVDRLVKKGCKHFVLAVTASDRISRGGDLYRTEQHEKFKEVLGGILDCLKAEKRTKEGAEINYKVIPVTVTGRLKYNDKGEEEEAHLAKDSENTAADPFLWIIDPWRMRLRKLAKVLLWSAFAVAALFSALYVGFRTWHGYHVEGYLNEAESVLESFGNTSSPDFREVEGKVSLEAAESNLEKVNEAWLVGDKDSGLIDKRLPGLLGKLMTNQVLLAYRNLRPHGDDYISPNRTFDGREELKSWPYWARNPRMAGVCASAEAFRESKLRELRAETLTSSAQYLIREAAARKWDGDSDVHIFLKHAGECLKSSPSACGGLAAARDAVLGEWEASVVGSGKINRNKVSLHVNAVITEDTGLNKEDVKGRIWSHVLEVQKGKAEEAKKKIMNGRNSLQGIALELFNYISEYGDSPYKGSVLESAKNRCNGAVSSLLASSKNRRDGFDDVFQAARKLHGLGSALCSEGNFGDNALYWLNPTNGNGVTFKYSSDWLRCRFHCAAVKVRTDHQANNPGSQPFTREVDANLVISFDPPKAGYPKRIGGDWLIKNKEGEGTWTFIQDSEIDVDMAATDILQVAIVEKSREDWTPDLPIPRISFNCWPGWREWLMQHEYKSDSKKYPNDAFYLVEFDGRQITGGPDEAFTRALEMARARADALARTRNEEESKAESERMRFVEDEEGR